MKKRSNLFSKLKINIAESISSAYIYIGLAYRG